LNTSTQGENKALANSATLSRLFTVLNRPGFKLVLRAIINLIAFSNMLLTSSSQGHPSFKSVESSVAIHHLTVKQILEITYMLQIFDVVASIVSLFFLELFLAWP
jgi:hypothetical protein